MDDGADETIKDANDLLKKWMREGVTAEEQRQRVEGMLRGSLTMAEAAARWAGGLSGPERDEGVRTVSRIIAQMDKVDRAHYRMKLAKLLGVGVREFNDLARAGGAAEDKEKSEALPTLGGWIDGWLVEYLYDPSTDKARLAYRDPSGKIGMAEELTIEGVRYCPKEPTGFVRNGAILFPSDLGNLKSTRELTAIVESFLHDNYLFETRYIAKLISYYVLMSWVYDSFEALCYLRAMGDAGSGKSELMKRVGYVCYRTMFASGANTTASLFRAIAMFRGTVFIDESDLYDSDAANDFVKLLNQGAMKANPIWRLEETMRPDGSKGYEPVDYPVFGPKLLAMRKEMKDDAPASRSITFKLTPREPGELKARGIKLYIDEDFRGKAIAIRNMLLRWRLHNWQPSIEVSEELMDLEISARLNQVTMPLKALAMEDPELMGEIERFLRQYNAEMVLTRSMSIAARVVEAMWKIYRYPDLRKSLVSKAENGEEYMMVGEVRRIANEIMDEMNQAGEADEEEDEGKRKGKKEELSARGVGAIIRNTLQLQVGQRRGNGYPVYWDQARMEGLARRYGVEVEKLPEVEAPTPAAVNAAFPFLKEGEEGSEVNV